MTLAMMMMADHGAKNQADADDDDDDSNDDDVDNGNDTYVLILR